MTDLRKAAQVALEALEMINGAMPFPVGRQAVSALRAALKHQSTHSEECWRWHHECAVAKIERQQDAEPVAWQYVWPNGDRYTTSTEAAVEAYTLGAEKGLLPEQLGSIVPLYAHPPRREWHGLTDEEKRLYSSWLDEKPDAEVFGAIEAALKEKNHDPR